MRFGIALHEATTAATLEGIQHADKMGISAVWLTSGSAEQMTLLAAAAVQTKRIQLGTAVVPTYPRHPVVLAQQASVLHTVSRGRFRLGVGPSHQPLMEDMLGLKFDKPLRHLREYVTILRQALTQGAIDFRGRSFNVKFGTIAPAPVPILTSALRPASFELAGEIADAAIAWICPARYLAEQALPALKAGAARARREVPPLIAHTFLCVHPNEDWVRADARKRLSVYPRLPFYNAMLEQAGDEESANEGKVSERLIDEVVVYGSEAECVKKLRAFAAAAHADEVIASLMAPSGADRAAVLAAGMRVVARLGKPLLARR